MGATNSKMEEDKALKLCRERKKYVREALDGRCSLAATHVAYIHSLKIVGTALRRFVEPDGPIESSLYTSTSVTPRPVTERTVSHFSFPSPTFSPRVGTAQNLSPSPSLPANIKYMKFGGTVSKKIEEKPPVPAVGTVASFNGRSENLSPSPSLPSDVKYMKFGGTVSKKIEEKTSVPAVGTAISSIGRSENPQFESSPTHTEAAPWDYFGLFHPIDQHSSPNEVRDLDQGLQNVDGFNSHKENDEKKGFDFEKDESEESGDEFDDPSTDTLVRSFENVNRVSDHGVDLESEVSNVDNNYSIDLPPMGAPSPKVEHRDVKISMAKVDEGRNKANVKDFLSNMKEIEHLFVKASDAGGHVPRMLEANKFHFRPIFPGKDNGSKASMLLKSCFSCGDDPSQVPEEPAQNSMKYLTWHRTASSRSSSSRNLIGPNARDDTEDLTSNLFDNFCMNSGSHASTLDRLYAWERKLYDEVKASEHVRKEYDLKCKFLRQLESGKESSIRIDKTRALVKDLHSLLRVSVHRIDTISKKIEELRDVELQPQLEELIEGLRRMWGVMLECHENQFRVISMIFENGNIKISLQSEARYHIASHLRDELNTLSSSFRKWINAQIAYVKTINEWLKKCVSLPQQKSRRKKRLQPPSILSMGPPPIYRTCHDWLEKLNALPVKEVVDSIKGLANEVSRLLPRQEKNQGKGKNSEFTDLLTEEAPENFMIGFDNFQLGLVGFIGKLNSFAECSVKMFTDLETAIYEAKMSYGQSKPRS